MVKRKRGKNKLIFIIIIAILILISALVIQNIFKKDIGLSPSQPTQVRVGVGNANPSITNLQAIPNVNLNPSPSTTSVSVVFTARDSNGADDLVDSSASAQFTNAGEPTRTGTCTVQSSASKEKTYQCPVSMNYFDKSGSWTVTVSAADTQSATATSSSTFTVNLLRDISINPTAINFPSVAPGQTNVLSTEQTTIINNGNFVAPPGTISALSYDLIGETNPAENIPAANFKIAKSSVDVCGLGDSLVATAQTTLTSSTLPRGASGSNTETISYCLTSVPEISSQFYSATGGSSLVLSIN